MIKEMSAVTTERKIAKVTYIVLSSASPEARDTLAQKIKKNIKRDMERDERNF